MESSKSIREYINNIFAEVARNATEKIKVEEYEKILCDCIENLIHETEEKERVKCFGGNCVMTFTSELSREKRLLAISNEEKLISREYVNSEVSLYFKDINDKWLNQKVSGKLDIEKFDLTDEGTRKFIDEIKGGRKIEHKIDL